MPSLIQEIKELLPQIEAAPLKTLGQNFMVEASVLEFMAASLNLKEADQVLEIGPGLGFLTRELLKWPINLVVVEKDRKYAAFLRKTYANRALVIDGDILKVPLSARQKTQGSRLKIAGNIPYNITSPILEWLIEHRSAVESAVLTMQWEVAQRLTANPGGKDWGPLSIFVQFYFDAAILRKISKNSFYPAPKVDSAVVALRPFPKTRVEVVSEEHFFKTVRHAFQQRRKTLLNALCTPEQDKKQIAPVLVSLGLEANRRPEMLSLQEWADLSAALFVL